MQCDTEGRSEFQRIERIEGKSVVMYFQPCRGYLIDHIKPLACGGRHDPYGMQWPTQAEAKANDKWQRMGCKGWISANDDVGFLSGPQGAARDCIEERSKRPHLDTLLRA